MLFEKIVTLYSNCKHHFVPIIGKSNAIYTFGKQIVNVY
ncbi:GTP cyclohydrolase I [Elizabethkingia bruuniana]|uniref:GTP cyclohydrolase I n=2 Tax=Elizabethkingia TaxID=308865 RepID=A0A7T7ZY16_9FLAO|nr:GTP cyclohydrolase I [Elizabethkingia anophelis]QDZ62215.1 hypothetical protein EVD20_04325 [Elizabethkingia bruuniana]MCT4071386.1 GTP cyclohydrolase I [Elizabethkingia anophelis]MCT4193618.1 GTP cyclohydrolase I [Elizabethkingia anophelis]MDV2458262.1 hypothetical protein [Elizabethkingia anophelis]